MSFFKDAVAIFKKRDLTFLESVQESDDVYSFLFEKEHDLTWKAGQHGLFSITHRPVKGNPKPFTVASAPAEQVVRITTCIRKECSDFKKALSELKPGMQVKIAGPVGSFQLQDDHHPVVLIAGGIGITPFRSMLKQLEAEGARAAERPIHLLYLESKRAHLFQDELREWADKTAVRINFLDARDALHQEIDQLTASQHRDSHYFVVGPQSMVKDIAAYLQNRQVAKNRIKKDAFWGYA